VQVEVAQQADLGQMVDQFAVDVQAMVVKAAGAGRGRPCP
jgi:hypothetical protein